MSGSEAQERDSMNMNEDLTKWGRGVCLDWCKNGQCTGVAYEPLPGLASAVGCSNGAHVRLMVQPGYPSGCLIVPTHWVPEFEDRLNRLGFNYSVVKDYGDYDDDSEEEGEGDILSFEDRAYLTLGYSEKDEVKGLGAWWDLHAKRWYVPPNTDVRPFAKWNPMVDGRDVIVGGTLRYPNRAYLSVLFDEKDGAKALGARWDPGERSWYVPPYEDLSPFEKWNPVINGVSLQKNIQAHREFVVSAKKKPKNLGVAAFPDRYYLSVNNGKEGVVKSMGAKFDGEMNKWYVPPDNDLQPFANWHPRIILPERPDGGPPSREDINIDVPCAVNILLRGGFNHHQLILWNGSEVQRDIRSPSKKRPRCSSSQQATKRIHEDDKDDSNTDDRKLPAVVSPEKTKPPRSQSYFRP